MRDNHLHLVLTFHILPPSLPQQLSDLLQRLPRPVRVNMHAPQPPRPAPVVVHTDPLLASQDAHVVAAVPAQVDPAVGAHARKEVEVSVEMARAVDEVDAAVGEEVDGVREDVA